MFSVPAYSTPDVLYIASNIDLYSSPQKLKTPSCYAFQTSLTSSHSHTTFGVFYLLNH